MALEAGHEYTLYLEYRGATGQPRTPPDITVTAPDGESEPIMPTPEMAIAYGATSGHREGRPFASIRPAVSGVFRFEVSAMPADQSPTAGRAYVAVGASGGAGETVSAILFLVGAAVAVVGAAVLIVRAVRRRRAVRATGESPPVEKPSRNDGWAPPESAARVDP